MTRSQVLELTNTTAQADVIIEKARVLGCWPSDIVIDPTPVQPLADLYVEAIMGTTKGKARILAVGPTGDVVPIMRRRRQG
jgi:hypothetical protein